MFVYIQTLNSENYYRFINAIIKRDYNIQYFTTLLLYYLRYIEDDIY